MTAPIPSVPRDDAPHRWRMLALLATAELLGMSLWFAGSAVAPQLQARFDLTGGQVAMLTVAVQLGFVIGTALSAVLNLADVIPARLLFASAATLGALASAPMAVAGSFTVIIASRFLSGVCLAGVYPPAMKMASTWFRERRGLAVGTVVGALTIGKAGPYLVHAIPDATVIGVTVVCCSAALLAAVLVLCLYCDGPHAFPPRPFSWSLATDVLRSRRWRLATGGYLGHMAELYSYWTWIPAFLAASVAGDAHALTAPSSPAIAVLSFAVIAVGGIGCVWGGWVADRIGRAPLVIRALVISGSCCALIGLSFGRSLWILAPLTIVWGFFIIADSAQFSVLVTESVEPHAVGTALTLQTSLGFLLTTITIQMIPPIVRGAGWPWAFAALAVGPVLGVRSIRRLQR
ncbi:MFS transporter [bacterium]|nr:MFS transporter [bacterium]